MASAEVGASTSDQVHTIDPATDLRKDDKPKEESASKKLVDNLLAAKAPIAAVVTKNMELLQEILMSERFQNLKTSKQSDIKTNEENEETEYKDEQKGQNSEKSEYQNENKEDQNENKQNQSEKKETQNDNQEEQNYPGSSKYPGKEQMELNQAMLVAVTSKQPEMLEKILDAGGDIHAFDKWYPVLHTIADMRAENLFDVAVKYAKNLTVTGHYGNLLHSAVRTGSFALVKKVYDLGVTEFIKCEANGSTVLHEAVRNVPYIVEKKEKENTEEKKDNSEIAVELNDPECKDSGENCDGKERNRENLEDKTDNTELGNFSDFEAKYDLSIMNFLLEKGCPVDGVDGNNKTPLIEAAILGNKKTVQTLIKAGASKSHQDNKEQTAWLSSALYCHPTLWEDLLDTENLNKPFSERNERYLIHTVCKLKLDEALQFILKNGADPLIIGNADGTPLHIAIDYMAVNCIRVLLNQPVCGLDMKYLNESPFQRILTKCTRFESESERNKILELFLEKGADINEEYDDGEIPLTAHLDSELEMIEWLLQNGADPNYIIKDGRYPLSMVCDVSESNRKDVLKLLLKYNADITMTSQVVDGLTPLQKTIELRDFQFAKYCLIAGFSLHLVHDWLRIEQDLLEDLEKSYGFGSLIWYMKNTPHQPMSLKGLTRIHILKCVGVTDTKRKILSFGLPKIMEDYLDWDKYIELRENEFERLMVKYHAMKDS